MTKITRRQFAVASSASAAATFAAPAVGQAAKARIVVVGGGFGGATAAKYAKQFGGDQIDVTLIEPNVTFYTCPFSNLVLGGLRNMASIGHGFDTMRKRDVTVIHGLATAVDTRKKTVKTNEGATVLYDRLILSPGIDVRWEAVQGYDAAAAEQMPHAWKAGRQTLLLKKQLEAMDDGGVVVIAPPLNPFRCPPGPYERASTIAHYLTRAKPKSKILIVDSKDKFSKMPLFMDAWKKFYGSMIEWIPQRTDGPVTEVDLANNAVVTDFGTKHKGAVVNLIPPQQAGKIAAAAGVTNRSGWAPVNHRTFESTLKPGIHVIGDAAISSPMPKSGFSASSQGKIVAAAAVDTLNGKDPADPSFANTCYSLVTPSYGISVAKIYAWRGGKLVGVEGSGGVSPRNAPDSVRADEARYAYGWYASISADIWG
ncbi:MAG: FCSD flavin-binding domain-containing protein [Rhodospirillaceae bacterium]|nr:FCSD flavin-binding domain-containing protein [Rhodospirillaceae bacterium]